MTDTPEGSTESGFMEMPGIEPATPGLQGIALHFFSHFVEMSFLSYRLTVNLVVEKKTL